ncbi:MAG: Lrp/AsnC family transcriptional regulator [Clostridia bacterium]|jgi:DNA-binding Lrp family transcriptional regulator|nr:Lrp/AsnC family transcriptional regulator [Clostridiaceae bacterium]
MQERILKILEKNGNLTIKQLAVLLDEDEEIVRNEIIRMKKEGVILGFNTVINWEKTERQLVTALIEVRVHPQKDRGFDDVADKISSLKQVTGCYLMSGGFDLAVMVEGKDFKEIALFVAEKLAVIDGVLSTATHFVLKKYKDGGVHFMNAVKDDREAIVL